MCGYVRLCAHFGESQTAKKPCKPYIKISVGPTLGEQSKKIAFEEIDDSEDEEEETKDISLTKKSTPETTSEEPVPVLTEADRLLDDLD